MLDELWERRNDALIAHDWPLFLKLDNKHREAANEYNNTQMTIDEAYDEGHNVGYKLGYDEGFTTAEVALTAGL